MQNSFLIIQSNPVIRLDLIDTLAGYYPDSDVFAFGSLEEARDKLAACDGSCYVFVGVNIVEPVVPDALMQALRADAHLVVVGATGTMNVPAIVLDVPFSTKMVIAAMRRAGWPPSTEISVDPAATRKDPTDPDAR